MEENLPANARRVGPCVVTRTGDLSVVTRTGDVTFEVTFMNGPVYTNLTISRAITRMVSLGCDHDEAETAVVHLLMNEAF